MMAEAGRVIRERGISILVFPEGGRSLEGLQPFKEGAAYIAIKSQVPILPVFIDGGFEVFNRHMKAPQPYDLKTGRRRKIILHNINILGENNNDNLIQVYSFNPIYYFSYIIVLVKETKIGFFYNLFFADFLYMSSHNQLSILHLCYRR